MNALLVIPEVKYDAASSDPGQLGKTNGFLNFMEELLSSQHALAPILGEHHVEDLGRISVFTHSGGYRVASRIATQGLDWLVD